MTVSELYAALEQQIPRSLSCPWDNDGCMCCPDGARPVRRVLIALDATDAVIDRAVAEQYDLIVTHHPLVFKPIAALNNDSVAGSRLLKLARAGISLFSFHTRADAVEGGVNDLLAAAVGLRHVERFGEGGLGRIGQLDAPVSFDTFAAAVRRCLGAPVLSGGDAGLPVQTVAVCGGGGKDFVSAAQEAGADTFLSGELGYHALTDAPDCGMNLLEAGHFYTETAVCRWFAGLIAALDASVTCTVMQSDRIRVFF